MRYVYFYFVFRFLKIEKKNDSFVRTEMLFVSLIPTIDHFAVECFVARPLDESKVVFLMLMMLFSHELVRICPRKAVRFVSKHGHLQPRFHSKARHY